MKQTRIIVLLVFALFLVMFVGLLFGSSGIGPIDAIKAIASILGFGDSPETHTRIILLMRLPRMLVSVLSGMALGLAGALSQTLFRNDLADPYIAGIGSGAIFGVNIAALRRQPDHPGIFHGLCFRFCRCSSRLPDNMAAFRKDRQHRNQSRARRCCALVCICRAELHHCGVGQGHPPEDVFLELQRSFQLILYWGHFPGHRGHHIDCHARRASKKDGCLPAWRRTGHLPWCVQSSSDH